MKVLVSDFDKTFYPDNFIDNIKEVNKFVDLGNIFIIATGRNTNSLRKVIDDYNIKFSYIICNDGSVIYDKDFNLIKKNLIKKDTVEKLYDYLSLYFEQVYLDNGFELTNIVSDEIDGIFVRYNDYELANNVLNEMHENFKDVHGYLSENYMNIVSIDSSKGLAIKYLELLNNYNNIYVVGDGINDLSMYEYYKGLSILNSIPELKEWAHSHVDDFIDAINYIKRG
jgi:hydroxymethylpyrimidine pyrophosphatase-like HAD family hydrolase